MRNRLILLFLLLSMFNIWAAQNDLENIEKLNSYFEQNQDKFCDKNSLFSPHISEFRRLNFEFNVKLIKFHLKWYPKHKDDFLLYYQNQFYGKLKRLTNFCFMYWWNPKFIIDDKTHWLEYMENIYHRPYKGLYSKMNKHPDFAPHVKWMKDEFDTILKTHKKTEEDIDAFDLFLKYDLFKPENDLATMPKDKEQRTKELSEMEKDIEVKAKKFFEDARKL